MAICIKVVALIILQVLFNFNIKAAAIEKVTILADDSYPPYSYVDNGKLKGIYIDIVNEAAKLINSHYQIELVSIPWQRGLLELKKGTSLALLPPYKHFEKRNFISPYSVPIMKENVVVFCNKNVKLSQYISGKAEKSNKPLRIGLNAGYLILNEQLERARKNKNIIIYENKSTSANILKLYHKRLDCYLNDKYSTLWELAKMSNAQEINFDNIKEVMLVMSQTAHIGYTNNPSHPYLYKEDFIIHMDQALSDVISSELYQSIIDRYVIKNE